METLCETVTRECACCAHVAIAWASPGGFVVQTRITTKRRLKKGDDGEWTYVTPERVTPAQWREAEDVVAKILDVHPNVLPMLVSYSFKPGGLYKEVFRRT